MESYGNYVVHTEAMDESVLKGILREDAQACGMDLSRVRYELNKPAGRQFHSWWKSDGPRLAQPGA